MLVLFPLLVSVFIFVAIFNFPCVSRGGLGYLFQKTTGIGVVLLEGRVA